MPILDAFIRSLKIKDKSIMFWPDLATSHYANIVTKDLSVRKIEFIPKENNPPNVPQCRPIENYWALVKQEYKARGNKCSRISDLKRIYNLCYKKVIKEHGNSLFNSFQNNLKNVSKKGLYSVIV